MLFSPEIQAEERRNERISALITAGIVLLLALLSLLWIVQRDRVPPPGEKEYEVLGAIDFGNLRDGSKKVNNFQPPVPDPAQSSRSTPQPAPKSEVSDRNPTAPPPVTTPKPSDVTTTTPPKPKTETPPAPPKTTTPSSQPSQPSNQPKTTPSQPSTELEYKPTTGTSGSNQGNNPSGAGNSGTPDIKVLDPDGLYSFAEGTGGGLQGRKPLSLNKPNYDCQQEGDMQFEFSIRADGSVFGVKPVRLPTSSQNCLVQRGTEAIRTWRFSAQPGAADQRVRVTIKFRLR
jgi:outer membrane biosynthesis protein TonB